jgi:hypothetical protein
VSVGENRFDARNTVTFLSKGGGTDGNLRSRQTIEEKKRRFQVPIPMGA